MEDAMDVYSKPVKVKKVRLGVLYYMNPRRDPNKPGRELFVTYDDRFPFVEGFKTHYSYLVRFLERGNSAGNHYHGKKHELFIPVAGEFIIQLEDTATKEKETLTINSDDYVIFYIKPRIAHKVTCKGANDILLVMATSPNSKEDEYPYKLD